MSRISTSIPVPQVGDTLRVRPGIDRRDAGATGVVTRLRIRTGRWVAVELEIAGQQRWFLKSEVELPELPPPPPPPVLSIPPDEIPAPVLPRRVLPPADFLRIARRVRRGRILPTLFIYIGRALLERWRESAGSVVRVDVFMDGGQLTLRAVSSGRYLLDTNAGRQPNIHCDGVRDLITLPDGRYNASIKGATLVVGEVFAGEAK